MGERLNGIQEVRGSIPLASMDSAKWFVADASRARKIAARDATRSTVIDAFASELESLRE